MTMYEVNQNISLLLNNASIENILHNKGSFQCDSNEFHFSNILLHGSQPWTSILNNDSLQQQHVGIFPAIKKGSLLDFTSVFLL